MISIASHTHSDKNVDYNVFYVCVCCNAKVHLKHPADFNDVFVQMDFDVKANDLRFNLQL